MEAYKIREYNGQNIIAAKADEDLFSVIEKMSLHHYHLITVVDYPIERRLQVLSQDMM